MERFDVVDISRNDLNSHSVKSKKEVANEIKQILNTNKPSDYKLYNLLDGDILMVMEYEGINMPDRPKAEEYVDLSDRFMIHDNGKVENYIEALNDYIDILEIELYKKTK